MYITTLQKSGDCPPQKSNYKNPLKLKQRIRGLSRHGVWFVSCGANLSRG